MTQKKEKKKKTMLVHDPCEGKRVCMCRIFLGVNFALNSLKEFVLNIVAYPKDM
jgi:hypothetical protein